MYPLILLASLCTPGSTSAVGWPALAIAPRPAPAIATQVPATTPPKDLPPSLTDAWTVLAKALRAQEELYGRSPEPTETEFSTAQASADDAFVAWDAQSKTLSSTLGSDVITPEAALARIRAAVAAKHQFLLGRAQIEVKRAVRALAHASDAERPQRTSELETAQSRLAAVQADTAAAGDTTNKTLLDAVAAAIPKAVTKTTAAFNWELIGGAQLSQEDQRFAHLREFLRFTGSERFGNPSNDRSTFTDLGTSWGSWSWNRLYSFTNVELISLPTSQTSAGTTTSDAERSASVNVGAEYRLAQWHSSDDGETGFASLYFRQGASTFIDKQASGVDTVNPYYGIGLHIGEHADATLSNRNPLLYRSFLLTYGDDAQLGNRIWTMEGQLRFGGDAGKGLFIGVRATLGTTHDENTISLFLGMNDVIGTLGALFKTASNN